MRYLVTDELKTPLLLKILRFFKLRKPRKEFFVELMSFWGPKETLEKIFEEGSYVYYKKIKIINRCKKREI